MKMNFQMKHIIITMILLHADTFDTEAKKNSEIVFYGCSPVCGRRWVSPPGAKLLPRQETGRVGGDKLTALFSQRRLRKKELKQERF